MQSTLYSTGTWCSGMTKARGWRCSVLDIKSHPPDSPAQLNPQFLLDSLVTVGPFFLHWSIMLVPEGRISGVQYLLQRRNVSAGCSSDVLWDNKTGNENEWYGILYILHIQHVFNTILYIGFLLDRQRVWARLGHRYGRVLLAVQVRYFIGLRSRLI